MFFTPIFQFGLLSRAVNIAENICSKQQNMSVKSALSRAGYNGVCTVHTYSGHKYMSVEGNYAAKIELIIQNESNLSKLSPCAWPYI